MGKEARGRVPWGRIFKWIGLSLLALVVLYVSGGVSLNWISHHRAGNNAEKGYQRWSAELSGWQGRAEEALAAAWGEPLATREQLSCATSPVDSGWFVSEYRHLCELTYVALFDAPRDAVRARDQLDGVAEVEGLFGGDEFSDTSECPTLRRSAGVRDEPGREVIYLPAEVLRSDDHYCTRRIRARDADHRAVDFQERTSGDLSPVVDRGDPVVAVSWTQRISSDRLGCSPFMVLFCNEPLWTGAQLPA